MCAIVDKMRDKDDRSVLSMDNIDKAATDIRALSSLLEMSRMEVVLLTAIVQRSSRRSLGGDDIAEFLGLEYIHFLTFDKEMESLKRKGYILVDSEEHIVMPKEVLQSLRQNKPVKPEPITGLDTLAILMRIKRIINIRENDNCTTGDAIREMELLLEQNPDTSIAKEYSKYSRRIGFEYDPEKMVLFGLIYRYHFKDDDMVGWHDFANCFADYEIEPLQAEYRREQMILQRLGVIKYADEDGVRTKDYFRIKDEIKDAIFADIGGIRKTTKKAKVTASRLLEAKDIAAKELVYNETEARQVAQLADLLSESRYSGIRTALQQKNLRTGFTCLFYGSPGTGKTETVYQLARQSGRDLFIVDVTKIKSCWVGESEQNLKMMFDKYRQCVRHGGITPILLFNEADAVLGIRQEGAQRAVDKMENSLQNIILQEMEDLDGILIATTNLTQNLDKAFERRFLYKIRFEKPTVEASTRIWRSMLPELSETEALSLATDFPFSGGQIENISRKKTIQSLLTGTDPTISDLRSLCAEEFIEKERRRIGY